MRKVNSEKTFRKLKEENILTVAAKNGRELCRCNSSGIASWVATNITLGSLALPRLFFKHGLI